MPTIDNGAVAKVKAVLEGWEAAWNAADMNAMWQLATDDIHWVNVVGMHWRGKAEVQKAHQVFFGGYYNFISSFKAIVISLNIFQVFCHKFMMVGKRQVAHLGSIFL